MSEQEGSRGIVDLQAVVLLGVEFFTSVGLFVVGYGTHILCSCLLKFKYNLTMANIQGRNM